MTVIRPISESEYAAWVRETIPGYAKEKVASGAWSADGALEKSKAELESLLPDGRDTKDNFLNAILAEDGAPVGMLWFAIKERADGRIAYLYNIEVASGHRRQGHAQRALEALEDEVRRLGLAGIALHVFGHNTSAHTLYARLGYLPTNIHMFKAVANAQARAAGGGPGVPPSAPAGSKV